MAYFGVAEPDPFHRKCWLSCCAPDPLNWSLHFNQLPGDAHVRRRRGSIVLTAASLKATRKNSCYRMSFRLNCMGFHAVCSPCGYVSWEKWTFSLSLVWEDPRTGKGIPGAGGSRHSSLPLALIWWVWTILKSSGKVLDGASGAYAAGTGKPVRGAAYSENVPNRTCRAPLIHASFPVYFSRLCLNAEGFEERFVPKRGTAGEGSSTPCALLQARTKVTVALGDSHSKR